ncbi:MAG: hypothetical protein A2041_03045 [Bacteroidetes bacterium GWA2_31_9b]|nr:MAG: hypothetical protein A2041_03045 [Bacteroidetes bacterium GWA2_31_9b]
MRFAIGDIHGCLKTTNLLIDKLRQISPELTLYFLGDYIDRGPDSRAVLDRLIELKSNSPSIYILRGNHEQMMLDTYKHIDNNNYILWQKNGSKQTLSNFSVPKGIIDISNYIPEKYIHFIESMPYFIETDQFFLSHAGINFNSVNPFTDTMSMIWMREENYNTELAKGKYIIHGHTQLPVEQIIKNIKNQNKTICIDSGCIYKYINGFGKLSALNLDTFELISIDNIDI